MATTRKSLEKHPFSWDKLVSLAKIWVAAMDTLVLTSFVCSFLFDLIVDLVFTEGFPDVSRTSITNFDALRKLGDEKMTALIKSLN